MTVDRILESLREQASPSVIKRYEKAGESQPYIGVTMGAINKLAKAYAKSPELALPLWRTGILEAQLVAIQLLSPKELRFEEARELVDDSLSLMVLDKLADRVLTKSPDHLALRDHLKTSSSLVKQRLAWRLKLGRISRKEVAPAELDQLIAEIAANLVASPEVTKWVMNQCLVEIAVRYPDYREQIIRLTEELAVYQDMVVAKGCTSAYAPDWIAARIKS